MGRVWDAGRLVMTFIYTLYTQIRIADLLDIAVIAIFLYAGLL
jgi:hypothetical protein